MQNHMDRQTDRNTKTDSKSDSKPDDIIKKVSLSLSIVYVRTDLMHLCIATAVEYKNGKRKIIVWTPWLV